jgi:hypothetical protein
MMETVLVSEPSTDLNHLMLLSAQEDMIESTVLKYKKTNTYQHIF